MIDAYSKIVLTVIAVALSVIATQQFVGPANALTTLEPEPCGKTAIYACWVKIVNF